MSRVCVEVVSAFKTECEYEGVPMALMLRRLMMAWSVDGEVRSTVDAAVRRLIEQARTKKAGRVPAEEV